MRRKLLSLAFLACAVPVVTTLTAPIASAQIGIGVTIGAPPPPRVLRARPVAPGSDFIWIDGYWYVVNGRYKWHAGYWSRPPYPGAVWIAPHHDGRKWFDGYWQGPGGNLPHDHRWDRGHDRDFNHH